MVTQSGATWSSRWQLLGSPLLSPLAPMGPVLPSALGAGRRGRTWSASVTQSQLGGPWGLLVQPRAATLGDEAAVCWERVNPKLLQVKPRNDKTWGLAPICLPR